MAQEKNTTNLTELLLQCMSEADPMLSMLEWLCAQLMEAEVSDIVGSEKNTHNPERRDYRCGYRPRRLDTRMGTMYLMVPKLRNQGYIPFFITERKRSEAALIQVVQEAFVQGVSTRKMEKLARSMGIESLSRSQVSDMTKGLNEQVEAFRTRPLSPERYVVLWVDALYEKVRMNGRVVNAAVHVVCGVDETGKRDILAVEPMLEESTESYNQLFSSLKERGMNTPLLVVSDAHKGLVRAITESFPGASWQRCKVHFMRNILAHVSHKQKAAFAAQLKEIWLSPSISSAPAAEDMLEVRRSFPKGCNPRQGLRIPWRSMLPGAGSPKDRLDNMLERLNKEIEEKPRSLGFSQSASYIRLVTYLIE